MTPGDELLFLALGGSGEIGMNVNLYGCRGKWIMVDLGMTFADPAYPGVELVLPDLAFIEARRDDLVGMRGRERPVVGDHHPVVRPRQHRHGHADRALVGVHLEARGLVELDQQRIVGLRGRGSLLKARRPDRPCLERTRHARSCAVRYAPGVTPARALNSRVKCA